MHDPRTAWNAPLPTAPPADARARERASTALVAAGVQEETARALVEWLATEPAESLVAVRPDTLPPTLSGPDPLDLLLAAAEVSVLQVRLLAVCNWCGGVARRLAALCEAGPTFVCGPCDLEQPTRLDVSLEAVFTPDRSFRSLEGGADVPAGPLFRLHHFHPTARAPDGSSYVELLPEHLAWVGDLRPGEEVRIELTGQAGDVLEVLALPAAVAHVVILAEDAPELEPAIARPTGFEPKAQTRRPGVLTLRAEERPASLCAVWIRRAGRRLQPASMSALVPARALYLHPRARSRLPDLVLPSQPLGVQDVTIWSGHLDVVAADGEDDLEVWQRLEQHFVRLRTLVVDQGGAVLKTMGDVVLAAFDEPSRALQATAAALGGAPDTRLRVGLAHGPALAVDSNGVADLFGRVVERAARLRALAEPGGLCVAAGNMDDELDAALAWWARRTEEVGIDGQEAPILVHRLRPG